MRVLGVDYGDSRIGVAISDPLGWTANGLETIQAKNQFHRAVEQVAEVCRKYGVQTVVVGYPKNMNGSLGFAAERSLNFKKQKDLLLHYVNFVRIWKLCVGMNG